MTRNMYPTPLELVTAAYDGSIAVNIGDLMYHDGNDAKPASSQADAASEAANQAVFAPKFLGVAAERKLSTDAAGDIDVALDWVGEMPCASAAYEVGDFVTVVEAASGTALENQKLTKTNDPQLAIGYCVKREGSAVTTVRVRLVSRAVPPAIPMAGTVTAAVAAAGNAQANATALTGDVNIVSAGDGTKGVKLRAVLKSTPVFIKNNENAVLKVYPASGGAINAIAADGAISMAALTSAVFIQSAVGQWYTIPLLPS
jgi:hypothetical protein